MAAQPVIMKPLIRYLNFRQTAAVHQALTAGSRDISRQPDHKIYHDWRLAYGVRRRTHIALRSWYGRRADASVTVDGHLIITTALKSSTHLQAKRALHARASKTQYSKPKQGESHVVAVVDLLTVCDVLFTGSSRECRGSCATYGWPNFQPSCRAPRSLPSSEFDSPARTPSCC